MLRRFGAPCLLGAFGALTGFLLLRTLWYLYHSLSNVLCGDGWLMLDEIIGRNEHRLNWSYLWSSFWGQRMVLSRLLFQLDAKLFSFSSKPLVLTNLAAMLCAAGLLCVTGWRLIGSKSRRWGWAVLLVTANLLLSGLQMEIFIKEVTNHLTIGYLTSVAAVVVLAGVSPTGPVAGRLFGSAALAGISTLCFPAGLLVWPVLFVESWILGCARRCALLFAVIGAVGTGVYAAGYQRPDMGMGLAGIVHRPVAALRIAAMILGGPISIFSIPLGIAAGFIGLAGAGYILFRVFRRRSNPPGLTIHAMIALYFFAVVLSLVAGRISPEWLAAQQSYPLPGRYFTPSFFFWASVLPASLFLARDSGLRLARLALGAIGTVVLVLTVGTVDWQTKIPEGWSLEFRTMDAAASAFFVNASDEEHLSRMFPDARLRDRCVNYLRRRRWSVFAEKRAGWVGKKLPEKFVLAPPGLCQGVIETVKPLPPSAALGITGRLVASGACSADPVEIVITDAGGNIIGLGRTIFPTFTLFGDEKEVGFLAYARADSGPIQLRIYAGPGDGRMSLVADYNYEPAKAAAIR